MAILLTAKTDGKFPWANTYSEEVAERICEEVANGSSLAEVAKRPWGPSLWKLHQNPNISAAFMATGWGLPTILPTPGMRVGVNKRPTSSRQRSCNRSYNPAARDGFRPVLAGPVVK